MRNKRLFSIFASAVMLMSPVVGTFAAQPVMAKSVKQTKKKAVKIPTISLKRRSVLYQLKMNKAGKVTKVSYLKVRGHKRVLNLKKTEAFWKIKKGGHYYYFIGATKMGKRTVLLAIKSNSVRSSAKRVPTLAQYNKKFAKKMTIKVKHLDFDGYISAKTVQETLYWVSKDNSSSWTQNGKLANGTDLQVMFKVENALTDSNNQKHTAYAAQYNKQIILVPAEAVDAQNVPSEEEYTKKVQDFNKRDAAYIKQQIKAAQKKAR